VAPAGDRDRVELDRPERPEDLEHPVEASRKRPRRREEVPRDEKSTRRLGSDLHLEDTSCPSVDRLTKVRAPPQAAITHRPSRTARTPTTWPHEEP